MNERPVRLIVTDDLKRSRLTVFFRALLALPHLIWLVLWGIAVSFAVLVNWIAALITARSPEGLHNFLAAYIRYAIHVSAYLFLIADPFPDFTGKPGYPVDVEISPPQQQNRWKVFFRLVLAIPAMLIAGVLLSGARSYGASYGLSLIAAAGVLGWFVALAQARMPRGLRDAGAYALSYAAQIDAYLMVLTDSYPSSDPQTALEELPARSDPVQISVTDDLRRSRLTVFFRLLLALPHVVWLVLWAIVVYVVMIVNWIATLIRGRSPAALHNFIAAYVRYQMHVYAYLLLIANPFPGFTGEAGSYPVDALIIAAPQQQNRWKVFFRLLLALPAFMVSSAYTNLLYLVALLGWFAALFTGRMPVGLRNAGALALRYSAQLNGYLLLLTDSYPYSGPVAQAPAVLEGAIGMSVAA